MADIFVSYRRDDSQWPAGRINERLEAVFGAGRVFFDTVTIRPGEDFHQVLGERVGSCRVLLAVIGPRWLDILEARLGEPNDFVRIEIAEGLQRKVRVIPVLIDGAKPPPAARLPDDLKALARLHAIPVRADTFRSDLDQLIGFLREYLDKEPTGERQGRIKVDAKIVHGAPDGWFKPGDGTAEWFKDLDVGPEMVVVPAGEFILGSSDGDDDEKPPHKVTIKAPFAVGRFAVTFAEWDASGLAHKPGDQGWGRGRRPVINVSWEDAKAYVSWLSQRTGKAYRLLSEAEWEFCCRAGTTTRYAFGDSISKSQAHCQADQTAEVGTFPANAWGLYDMHGNVWEWCADNWHPNYQGAPGDGSVWPGGDVSLRVLRGGSWNFDPDELRSADRNWLRRIDRGDFLGFRVSRTL
jgi:formylglycine-generating enzyme required for sulfatase activity